MFCFFRLSLAEICLHFCALSLVIDFCHIYDLRVQSCKCFPRCFYHFCWTAKNWITAQIKIRRNNDRSAHSLCYKRKPNFQKLNTQKWWENYENIHFDDKNQTSFAKRVDPLVSMLLRSQHFGALFFDFGFRVSQRISVLMFDGITNIDLHRYDSAIYACVSFLHFGDPILLFHSLFFVFVRKYSVSMLNRDKVMVSDMILTCQIVTKTYLFTAHWSAPSLQKMIQ